MLTLIQDTRLLCRTALLTSRWGTKISLSFSFSRWPYWVTKKSLWGKSCKIIYAMLSILYHLSVTSVNIFNFTSLIFSPLLQFFINHP